MATVLSTLFKDTMLATTYTLDHGACSSHVPSTCCTCAGHVCIVELLCSSAIFYLLHSVGVKLWYVYNDYYLYILALMGLGEN